MSIYIMFMVAMPTSDDITCSSTIVLWKFFTWDYDTNISPKCNCSLPRTEVVMEVLCNNFQL